MIDHPATFIVLLFVLFALAKIGQGYTTRRRQRRHLRALHLRAMRRRVLVTGPYERLVDTSPTLEAVNVDEVMRELGAEPIE